MGSTDPGRRGRGAVTPIYFDGCFGWLHEAQGGAARPGVVLCPAFAQEEVCTHYGMMALAERLAAAGFPTLRFDPRGTGDSVAAEATLDGLVDDAVRAADCLRQRCGVEAVAMVGLRLGAAVATLAAERMGEASALVLMAPVLSGQAFLRETRAAAAVASLSGLDPVMPIESDHALNTNGFHWPAAFQRAVAAIDLQAPPACPVMMNPARGDRRTARLAESWRAAGTAVTERPFADYEGWMQDPTTSQIPQASFAAIAAWLVEHALPVSSGRSAAPVAVTPVLEADDFVEEPVRFGADGVLFGILCRPRAAPAASIAALLLHEGSTHHIGNGGAYVALARRMAGEGTASLRMDLTGMGDSPAGDNARHPHYDPERIAEGVAGIDRLAEAGFAGVVAFGLCSGAHTALQVTLADRRVVGNFVVNLQKFVWHYGDDIRVAVRDNKRSLKAYLRAMRNPGEWRRALSGEADLKGIARVLAKRGALRAAHALRSLLPPAPDSEIAIVRAQMRTLAERGVHSTLVFSDEDPGLPEMSMKFGRKARRLAAFAPARMVLLDCADHHFNGVSVRRRHADLSVAVMKAAIDAHGERACAPSPLPPRVAPSCRAAA
nr:alpha/beta fold hydrolase [Sphingomonas sp. CROZ-RG-20F-R02-07]